MAGNVLVHAVTLYRYIGAASGVDAPHLRGVFDFDRIIY